ncbi:hypothetical protein BH09SUM1_BH09SUM1_15790 [soil metagenome]
MSERITKSMYDGFPFEKRELLNHVGWFQRKVNRLKRIRQGARVENLKRKLSHDCIADKKVDFTAISKFTADSFPESGPLPWLDRPDAMQQIDKLLAEGKITAERAEQAKYYCENGYVILKGFFPPPLMDEVWANYVSRVFDGKVPVEIYQKDRGDLFLGRCLNPHVTVPKLKTLTRDPRLVDLVSFLLGVPAIPFQTIIGFAGSEQLPHSDAIHMTTYPNGYLAAAWIAFEDIHPDSGPLVYFPGSHKLPYLFTHHMEDDEVEEQYKHTTWYNDVYEKAIQELIEKHGLTPKYLNCEKGDVLVWHSNLIHGGSRRNDPQLSRKALVGHYFGEGALCYGDRHEAFLDPYQG